MNTTENTVDNSGYPADYRAARAVRQWLATNADQLRLWRQRADARRRLLAMEDHELADIGVTREEAQREAAKRFWEA